jgi:hypothetical protein
MEHRLIALAALFFTSFANSTDVATPIMMMTEYVENSNFPHSLYVISGVLQAPAAVSSMNLGALIGLAGLLAATGIEGDGSVRELLLRDPSTDLFK